MIRAEIRLLDSSPGMYRKVRELKSKYNSLYDLDEIYFMYVIVKALRMNIKDGFCKDMSERLSR